MKDIYPNKDILNIANKVIRAALDLRNSGYDGPFIGDVTADLFSALADLEKSNYFKLFEDSNK